jgi:L-rhamnose mutarotase
MPRRASTDKREAPDTFAQRNQAQYQRVVRLTRQGIAELQARHQSITLLALSQITASLDQGGKGLSPRTILRNAEAAELFHQHSPAYQERQQEAKKAKRKRSKIKVNPDVRATYKGLHAADYIQMVEELKAKIEEMKVQQAKLQKERDEAYSLRNQALEQNTRQLAALTARTKGQAAEKKS